MFASSLVLGNAPGVIVGSRGAALGSFLGVSRRTPGSNPNPLRSFSQRLLNSPPLSLLSVALGSSLPSSRAGCGFLRAVEAMSSSSSTSWSSTEWEEWWEWKELNKQKQTKTSANKTTQRNKTKQKPTQQKQNTKQQNTQKRTQLQ